MLYWLAGLQQTLKFLSWYAGGGSKDRAEASVIFTGEEVEAGGKRRRVTPRVPRSLGHLCSVAAALSSESASPAQCLASSTPDACEAAQPPHSCPSPSCPEEPELHVSTGEELSSASSSDLDSSSPDSCYEQAYICDAGARAAPAPARLQGSSSLRRQQLPQPCAQHMAPPRSAPRQQRRSLGQAEVYRFGQGMQLRSSRLSVAGAPRECHRTRSGVAKRAPASEFIDLTQSPSTAPGAPAVPTQAQPVATVLRIAALQVAASAPAQTEPVPLQVAGGDQPAAGGDTTVAVANLMAGHSLARLPPAQLALLIANHNGSDPVLTQALQCAMAALSDAQLGAVGCAFQSPYKICCFFGPISICAIEKQQTADQPELQSFSFLIQIVVSALSLSVALL